MKALHFLLHLLEDSASQKTKGYYLLEEKQEYWKNRKEGKEHSKHSQRENY